MHQWSIGNDPDSFYWQAYKPDDITAHTGNLNWIFPLGNGFLYAWRHGISVFLYDGRFEAEKWFELLAKYKITNLASVPTAYRIFLTVKEPSKTYDLSNLRYAISAGEPLNAEVVEAWEKEFGWQIHEGIGMTEIMVYLSNIPGMEVRAGSMGRPQPGHKCAIIDDDGKELPPNTQGHLAIKTPDPGLFKEYWNKPDKTKDSFIGEWFVTGDNAMMDPDGYFWFEGRGDDLIMTAGYRVSPFEVESAVIEHPSVLEAAAVSSPDETRGVIVKAFVILKDNYEPSDELAKEIKDTVKAKTAPYKYPREIEFVKELPKTQSGKIIRRMLRAQEEEKKGKMFGKHRK